MGFERTCTARRADGRIMVHAQWCRLLVVFMVVIIKEYEIWK